MKKVLSVVLAVLMLTAIFAVSVAADDYPSLDGRDYFVIDIDVDGDQGGTALADPATVPKGEEVTITAKPDEGNEFDHWEIIGDYEIIEGDLNSPVIKIRPLGDIKFVAHFKEGGPKKDGDKTSPTTGYNTSATIIVMAAVLSVSAAAVAFTGKKYFAAK